MHPALSVILFTTLSGTGYGMLFWIGLHSVVAPPALRRSMLLAVFGVALVLVSIGLFASLAHLGKPLRAWRAFSQWRSSWLSREGVLAVVTYVPALALLVLLWRGERGGMVLAAGIALTVCTVATIVCTAMIYASLKPIAAWRHRLVVPTYLAMALLGGGLALATFLAAAPWPSRGWLLGGHAGAWVLLLAVLCMKLAYWRDTDSAPLASTAESATGLGAFGRVKSFEAPHTQANYLLREMGFVLARKHSGRLRQAALVLLFVVPQAVVIALQQLPVAATWLLGFAALSFQLGAFIERWLFFAQARHTVALYYRAGES